jgi:hypothetical protein
MNYKFCPKCGKKNEDFDFCPSCGANLKMENANLVNHEYTDQTNPELIWERLEMCQVILPSQFDVNGVGRDIWEDEVDPLSPEMTLLQSNLFFLMGEIEILKSNPKHDIYKNFINVQLNESQLYFGDVANGLPHGYGFIFVKITHYPTEMIPATENMIRDVRNIECNVYFEKFDLILNYCGQFKNGLKDGGGVLYNTSYATIDYNGRFVNDRFHGTGTIYLEGKSSESGEFRNGEMFERISGKDQFGNYNSYLDDDDEDEDEDDDNEV